MPMYFRGHSHLAFTPSRGASREKERKKRCVPVPVVTCRLHSLKRVALMTTCVSAWVRAEKRARQGHARAARTHVRVREHPRRLSSPSTRAKGFASAGNGHLRRRYCHWQYFAASARPNPTPRERYKINKASRLLLIRAQCNKLEWTAQGYGTRRHVRVKWKEKKEGRNSDKLKLHPKMKNDGALENVNRRTRARFHRKTLTLRRRKISFETNSVSH